MFNEINNLIGQLSSNFQVQIKESSGEKKNRVEEGGHTYSKLGAINKPSLRATISTIKEKLQDFQFALPVSSNPVSFLKQVVSHVKNREGLAGLRSELKEKTDLLKEKKEQHQCLTNLSESNNLDPIFSEFKKNPKLEKRLEAYATEIYSPEVFSSYRDLMDISVLMQQGADSKEIKEKAAKFTDKYLGTGEQQINTKPKERESFDRAIREYDSTAKKGLEDSGLYGNLEAQLRDMGNSVQVKLGEETKELDENIKQMQGEITNTERSLEFKIASFISPAIKKS